MFPACCIDSEFIPKEARQPQGLFFIVLLLKGDLVNYFQCGLIFQNIK